MRERKYELHCCVALAFVSPISQTQRYKGGKREREDSLKEQEGEGWGAG